MKQMETYRQKQIGRLYEIKSSEVTIENLDEIIDRGYRFTIIEDSESESESGECDDLR